MKESCLEVTSLNYKDIFSNFNISFDREKFITVAGPNNCGKTTLIRIIDSQILSEDTIMIYGIRKEDYKISELSNLLKVVIPKEIVFQQATVEDELAYQLSVDIPKNIRQERVRRIAKDFELTKYLTESVENLSEDLIIRLQLALSVIKDPKIIVIDDISPYFTSKELLAITKKLKTISETSKITIIMVTSNLELALLSDYTYIIDKSKIVLEGDPISVLEHDNIINKVGLNLPFMLDLSVKLRDYDLIKEIELDADRLVDTLWKWNL